MPPEEQEKFDALHEELRTLETAYSKLVQDDDKTVFLRESGPPIRAKQLNLQRQRKKRTEIRDLAKRFAAPEEAREIDILSFAERHVAGEDLTSKEDKQFFMENEREVNNAVTRLEFEERRRGQALNRSAELFHRLLPIA